jgi:hypothetical protein
VRPSGAPSGPASGAASAAVRSPSSPSAAECEALWLRYRAEVPGDPFVAHDGFVARCERSDRDVLRCPEHAKQEARALLRQVDADYGGEAPSAEQEAWFLRLAMPSRHAICVARERVRFAAGSGELAAIASDVASGRLRPGEHGVVVMSGASSTLPSVGLVEGGKGPGEIGPAGELRAFRRPGGRVWIYVLGGLLGRHQNQVGFLYSSGPFVPGDFREGEGGAQVCLEPGSEPGTRATRYMLSCFGIVRRLDPALVEVGAAPD